MKIKCIQWMGLLFMMTCFSPVNAAYHSQANQDRFVNEMFFKDKRDGVFIDIGAYNGVTISNSLFFEQELGWTGICIEPLPRAFEQLTKARSATCLNCAIGPENGILHFLEIDSQQFPELAMLSGATKFFNEKQIEDLRALVGRYHGHIEVKEVPVKNLNEILVENNIYNIDFLSIDVEGGELEILSSLDFNTFYIHVMTVENNEREANPKIQQFLESKGFRFVSRLEQDEVYENTIRL